MNRLKLNFSIDTIEERTEFLHNYLNSINFSLTPEEKETCANYILWGKEKDGKKTNVQTRRRHNEYRINKYNDK